MTAFSVQDLKRLTSKYLPSYIPPTALGKKPFPRLILIVGGIHILEAIGLRSTSLLATGSWGHTQLLKAICLPCQVAPSIFKSATREFLMH